MTANDSSSGESIAKPSRSQIASGTLVSLQIGRGIAALLVALFHAGALVEINCGYSPLHGVLAFGYAGVDFFFVLSGFIIFRRHIRDRGRPEQLADFGLKRFRLCAHVFIFPFSKFWAKSPYLVEKSLVASQ